MAATRLMALHARAGSIESALRRSTEYISNGEKTKGGDLVMSYECDQLTAPQEFLLAKRQYAIKTGRDQGGRDVIAYHLRQSFKPGEATPELAGRIAWETVMSLTKGRHAFVIAVHVDREHIHSHTVFNSTSLDCTRKFRDFKRSGLALRRISDTVCLSHGLSVIENPKERGQSYDKWLGNKKPLGNREQLAFAIDSVLPKCKTWEGFLAELKSLGCEAKAGANVSIKLPGAKRFARLSSMPVGYDENSLRARLSGEMEFEPKPLRETGAAVPKLLIDIQAKMREGYGKGFENWAKVENLKRSAKTLLYIQESRIGTYEELEQKCRDACDAMMAANENIKAIEIEQREINELQKHIGAYGKNRAAYNKYRAMKNPREKQAFYEANRDRIDRCQAAVKHFDAQGLKGTAPSINSLKEKWGQLETERRHRYGEYKAAKKNFQDLCAAKSNAHRMLGLGRKSEASRG